MQCTHGFVRDPLDKYRLFMVNGWLLLYIEKICDCCLAGHSGRLFSHVGSNETVVRKWRSIGSHCSWSLRGTSPRAWRMCPHSPCTPVWQHQRDNVDASPLTTSHCPLFCPPSQVKHYPTFISGPWGKAVTGAWAAGLFTGAVLGVREFDL